MFRLTTAFQIAAMSAFLALMPHKSHACSLSLRNIAFGTIDRFVTNEATGSVEIASCESETGYQISIDTTSTDGVNRLMINQNQEIMIYQLFPDRSFTIPWGDGVALGLPVSGTNDGNSTSSHTIFALIPRQPELRDGLYSDNLTVTLTY